MYNLIQHHPESNLLVETGDLQLTEKTTWINFNFSLVSTNLFGRYVESQSRTHPSNLPKSASTIWYNGHSNHAMKVVSSFLHPTIVTDTSIMREWTFCF